MESRTRVQNVFDFAWKRVTSNTLLLVLKWTKTLKSECWRAYEITTANNNTIWKNGKGTNVALFNPVIDRDKFRKLNIERHLHTYSNICKYICKHAYTYIYHHHHPWPSLSNSSYRSSPLAGLQGYIPYPHRAAVWMFQQVVLFLLGHMWGFIGVHHLWARPCLSSSVLHVWFV